MPQSHAATGAASSPKTSASTSPIGRLLKHWRAVRRLSQLDLALAANVSARHLSFVETGRARPSAEMVLQLARVLEVPLREQNLMLEAAGFAPRFRAADLDDPALAGARKALEFLMKAYEPSPALVVDRHWNMLMGNNALGRMMAAFMPPEIAGSGERNVLRLLFHPGGIRRYVTNWEELAGDVIERAHREALGGVPDEGLKNLLDELAAMDGVPAHFARPRLERPPAPLVAMHLRKDGVDIRLFTMITTFGTAQDVTLQELRIEAFYPTDPDSQAALARIAGDA
jgi:transcriptional regulator with XRE-family HTH domain